MENILNLETYNKYLNLIQEGLLLVPDNNLSTLIDDVDNAYRAKPYMKNNEVHEVSLKAGKKVRITSRGSLRDIEIDGITYDSSEQAACSIYDSYDNYYDIYHEIRSNLLNFTFIPIIDTKNDTIRYTISKYSKGLSKYFDPHKVIKAVYSIDNILFYVKDDNDILKKYYYRIGSFNLDDCMSSICKAYSSKYSMDTPIYLAFFIHEEDLPFTIGACKEDFYALKDILNKISFKGTTPLKYLIFKQLKQSEPKLLKTKEAIAYNYAMHLSNISKKELCNSLDIDPSDYDKMMEENLQEILDKNGKKLSRTKIAKFLNIVDNITEIHYYEERNLIWKVKYNEIPSLL